MEDKIINYISETPENTNPAVLHTLLGDLNKQPDWNQNDKTAPDYVKNRPFYEETSEVVMLPETSFEMINEGGIAGALLSESFPYEFEVGKEYIVTLDGVAKTYTAVDEDGSAVVIIRLSQGLSNSLVLFKPNDTKLILTTSDVSLLGTHTIKISEGMTTTHKIDSKYIDRGSLGIEPLVLYKKQM